jgi:hypothetical protein
MICYRLLDNLQKIETAENLKNYNFKFEGLLITSMTFEGIIIEKTTFVNILKVEEKVKVRNNLIEYINKPEKYQIQF